jgi:hypothetical protein
VGSTIFRSHFSAAVAAVALFLFWGETSAGGMRHHASTASGFTNPRAVTILGYADDAMEPFVTPDYLLWNNRNDPAINTDLHYAARIDDLTFDYRGRILGANTKALEGTPTMDQAGWLYFVSTRKYFLNFSTIYRAHFSTGTVSGVMLVPNISLETPGMVNFDVGISPDGATLYFVDGLFDDQPGPRAADLVVAHRSGDFYARRKNSAALLAAVNTDELEYAPAVSADGLELYFTRLDRAFLNPPAIFVATRSKPAEPFGEAVLIAAASGFVEAPALSPDERGLYYHRLDGDNRFRIYRISR